MMMMMIAITISSPLYLSCDYFLKNILIYLCIYFWLHWVFTAVRAFSSCSKRGLLFVVVRRLLIAVTSLVAEHGL